MLACADIVSDYNFIVFSYKMIDLHNLNKNNH